MLSLVPPGVAGAISLRLSVSYPVGTLHRLRFLNRRRERYIQFQLVEQVVTQAAATGEEAETRLPSVTPLKGEAEGADPAVATDQTGDPEDRGEEAEAASHAIHVQDVQATQTAAVRLVVPERQTKDFPVISPHRGVLEVRQQEFFPP